MRNLEQIHHEITYVQNATQHLNQRLTYLYEIKEMKEQLERADSLIAGYSNDLNECVKENERLIKELVELRMLYNGLLYDQPMSEEEEIKTLKEKIQSLEKERAMC